MALSICLDARLIPGQGGGVEQALVGLAGGLACLSDGEEDYHFLTYVGASDWLLPHLGGRCRLLPGPAAPPNRAGGSWRALARALWHQASPLLGRRNVPIPLSGGHAERAGCDILHFPHQQGFDTGLPSIYQPWDLQHRHLPGFFTPRERLAREVLYRHFCEHARLVVVPTRWGRDDLLRAFGLPAEKVKVIPAAPLLPFSPAAPEPAASPVVQSALTSWASTHSAHEAFLLYPAQTWAHKNHAVLLDALVLLRERDSLALPLVCCGRQNAHYPAIQRRVQQLGLDKQVHFVGYVDSAKLWSLYKQCRGLVFPSLFEGFGMPVLEAFQAGVPAAVSTAACLPEVAGGAALLFDPRRPDELADILRRLWLDESLRQQLVERGRRRAADFSWEHTARLFRALYRHLGSQPLSEEDQTLWDEASAP